MAQQGQDWISREERRTVQVQGTAHLANGVSFAVRLANISYRGCQVEADHILPIGDRVRLELPRLGDVPAEVRWALPGKAGLRFLLNNPAEGEPAVPAS